MNRMKKLGRLQFFIRKIYNYNILICIYIINININNRYIT